jgi:hypothetical protein
VVLLPSYESLCKVAHGVGATVLPGELALRCPPPRDCVHCPLAEPGAAAARRAQDAALASARTLIACSEAVAAAARSWTKRDDVLVAASVGEPPRATGSHGGHVLVAAGVWGPHKGRALIEPIAGGLSGHRVVVTAPGLGAAERRQLQRLGAQLGDAQIGELLDGSGACVIPSQWPEPFGRIAFEAQSCGVPVIAPRTGGLAEHVAQQGLLAPDAGGADYVAAVCSLDDPSAWAYASSAARAAAAAVVATRPLALAADAVEAAAS